MASSSFLDSINSLGWSRRAADEPVTTGQRGGLLSSIRSLNPFGNGGYVQLPVTEGAGAPLPAPSRREEEEGWLVCESSVNPKFPRTCYLPAGTTRAEAFHSTPCRWAADGTHAPRVYSHV